MERNEWKTKKRRKYANKIVDRMQSNTLTIDEFQRTKDSSKDLHALVRAIANISITITHIPAKKNSSGRIIRRPLKIVQRLASKKDTVPWD